MGCTSSKQPQVFETTRTEQTPEGYKVITEKRTRHPGLFGCETVETVTATVEGNPTLVAMIEDGVQYDYTSGQGLHEFGKDWAVRVALAQVAFKSALEERHGSAHGDFDMATRVMSFGTTKVPSVLLAVINADGPSVKLTWAWGHPAWNEKLDGPVKRLQLVGQTLHNKDLTANALLIDPESRGGRGDRVVTDAVHAAAKILGWNAWYLLPHPDGSQYLFIGKLDEAKPPLPAEATRKPDLGDLHKHFGLVWDVLSPGDFRSGVVGMAAADGCTYANTANGWSVTEPGASGRQLEFKLTGTNAEGKPEYEHTLHSSSPIDIGGQAYDLRVAYTIKSTDTEGPPVSSGPPGPETDCAQLFAFAADTALYTQLTTFEWFQGVATFLNAGADDLDVRLDGANRLRISGPGKSVLVPVDHAAILDKTARTLEWTYDRGAAQVRSAGTDVGNADLMTAKLTAAPGLDMGNVVRGCALAAAKATGRHVCYTATWPSGETSVFLLRVEDVDVPNEPLRLPPLYHYFAELWALRAEYDLTVAARGLAAKQGWVFTDLAEGWTIRDPVKEVTFTFRPDPARETGQDYRIALDTSVVIEADGAPLRLNIHIDNSPKPPQEGSPRLTEA